MIVMKINLNKSNFKKIGRPQAFNRDDALNNAMLAFWKHGYETTSMSLISTQMNMNAPSIYSAFGDKKALFLQALNRYVGKISDIKKFVDNASSAFNAAQEILRISVIRFTGKDTPNGCMLASAVASGSPESADVQAVASKIRWKIETILKCRISLDIKNGILPKTASANDLAALTITIIQGLSVLARDGASRKKLNRIVIAAMSAWPSI
jgi:AcrR family transcriptional regulator